MASSNLVMNRVKMFEQQKSSSEPVESPVPIPSRQSSNYGKQSPASEPPKWRTELNATRNISNSPVVQEKSDGNRAAETGRSFTDSASAQGNKGVAWPLTEVNASKNMSAGIRPSQVKSLQSQQSPESSSGQKVASASKPVITGFLSSPEADSSITKTTGFLLPSQIKAMQSKQISGSSPGQKASPASNSGVLGSRVDSQIPKSTAGQATPTHANMRKTQHVSPFSREVIELKSTTKYVSPFSQEAMKQPVVGRQKPDNTSETALSTDQPAVSRKESPNPAASFSHDENEAPQNSSVVVPSKAELRSASQQVDMARTRSSSPEGYISGTNLYRSLNDASTVIQEEKESSIGSSASSLSIDELSNIARRALTASQKEEQKKGTPAYAKARASPLLERKHLRRRHLNTNGNERQEHSIGKSHLAEIKIPSGVKTSSEEKAADRTAAISLERNAATKVEAHEDLSESESQKSGETSASSKHKKKSRSELFEAARQRAGSRSPSPVMMTSSAGAAPAPLSKKDSRLAILSAGRRKMKSSGLAPLQSQKSVDTINSEDGSFSADDNSVSRSRRTERMARLAAAYRRSPVPKTANETSATSKALPLHTSNLTAKISGAPAKSRRANSLQRSSYQSVSTLLPNESKNESANVTGTKNSLSQPASRVDTAAKTTESRTSNESSLNSSRNRAVKSQKASPTGELPTSVSERPQGELFLTASSRTSDHQASHAKKVALPSLSVDTKSSPNRPSNNGIQKPVARPMDENTLFDDAWNEVKQPQETLSELSSSQGGVKAAIDAWSTKSKDTRKERPARTSPRENGAKVSPKPTDFSAFDRTTRADASEAAPRADSPGSFSFRTREDNSTITRETKQSDGSWIAHEEANTISSETSVGGSHASTFISSPSSYASSHMTVGAPGSFFRPMEAVNDFEEATNDHIMLGQLSVESTDDEESSELPSHLFKSSSYDASKSGDSDLSFLLEQMQSDSETEDSGIRLLSTNGTTLPEATKNDNNDQSTLIGQYHIKSSSEDSTTAHRTLGTNDNEKSTLLGQSLLDSALYQESKSSDTSDSHVVKWWQNTDPLERRKRFESTMLEKSPKQWAAPTNLFGMAMKRKDSSEDLFSGLSYDEASENDIISDQSESVFSGMTPPFETANLTCFPPPPPAPRLETSSTSDQYGTILLHGSQAIDSVSSDITTSVLADNVSRDQVDWARREATEVIKEELTAELEEEEETVHDGDVLSDSRQKEGNINTGNSRSVENSATKSLEPSIYAGTAPYDDEASGFIAKDDSIFMRLGQKILDAFPICWAPIDSFEQDGSESHSMLADSRSPAQSPLNDYEQKVWDEWHKQDSKSGTKEEDSVGNSNASEAVERQLEDIEHQPEVIERRENAHRKLNQYADSAKTASKNKMASEPSIEDTPTEKKVKKLEAVAVNKDPVPAQLSSPITLSSRRILEKFSSTMKHHGMEVLKLNRDKKWQERFITVSKEVLWVKAGEVNSHSGDRAQCPIGILWMKRFIVGKEYGVSAIGRLGRGGVLCDQLVKVSASARSSLDQPLSKKHQDKFKDAVPVNLEYTAGGGPKCVVLLCKTTDAAHFLCTGLRVIMDVLKKANICQEGEL